MAGRKEWAFKEKLMSADLNSYLMDQVVPRFASTGDRDSAIDTPEAGQLAYVNGVGLTLYSGTAWVTMTLPTGRPSGIAAGEQTVTWVNGTDNSADVAVTFPAGRFASAPAVTATQASMPGGSDVLIPKVTNVTSSGFTLRIYTGTGEPVTFNGSTQNVIVHWIAVARG